MRSTSRLLFLLALLLGSMLLAVRMGAVPLTMGEIVEATRGSGSATAASIVLDLRLPRTVLAALVGAALAGSGAAFQALLRNPLAEPYILGVSGGAAMGAVAAIVFGFAGGALGLPLAAFGGALLAIVVVLRIALTVGRALDTRILLLSGIGPAVELRRLGIRVVADLENEVRRILDFCGLPFEPACLRFHETERAIKTASSEQVRRPIYPLDE
mgnify:CR=1 FL=1